MEKPKFNLMDGFLIALICIIIAAVAFLLLSPGESGEGASQTKTAQYQLQLSKYEKIVADAFLEAQADGETLLVGERERFGAEIINIEVTPTKHIITTDTGETVIAENPMYYDILLTLQSQVTDTPSSITAGSTELKVGTATAVKSKKSAGYGYIVGLTLQ